MKNQNIIFFAVGGFVLIVGCCVAYYFSLATETIDRFEGPIPFVYTSGINKTIRHYIETRPSRFVLLLGGPSQSGKSRLIDILAQESSENLRLVIKLDAAEANSFEEFSKFLKVAIVEGLTKIRSSISINKLKSVDNEIEMTETTKQTVSDPKIQKLFSVLEKTIDSSYKNGVSEKSIRRFFDILEVLSDDFHPIIFIHNYDKISTLATENDPEFGSKLIQSLTAILSRRDLYKQTIPIVLEVKNTLYLLKKDNNQLFRYFEMDELGDVTNELVVNAPIFNAFELKKVIKQFGAHGGSIAKIFESLRYGKKIDDAIDSLYNTIRKITYDKVAGNQKALNLAKKVCEAKGVLNIKNITEIEGVNSLFNGLLYLTKEFQIKVSNKAVTNALCAIEP